MVSSQFCFLHSSREFLRLCFFIFYFSFSFLLFLIFLFLLLDAKCSFWVLWVWSYCSTGIPRLSCGLSSIVSGWNLSPAVWYLEWAKSSGCYFASWERFCRFCHCIAVSICACLHKVMSTPSHSQSFCNIRSTYTIFYIINTFRRPSNYITVASNCRLSPYDNSLQLVKWKHITSVDGQAKCPYSAICCLSYWPLAADTCDRL